MSQEKKHLQPDIDWDAQALLALSEARATPPGPERSAAMKRAGILRNAVDKHGLAFPKLGRPAKTDCGPRDGDGKGVAGIRMPVSIVG
jgi:hypothetical protein